MDRVKLVLNFVNRRLFGSNVGAQSSGNTFSTNEIIAVGRNLEDNFFRVFFIDFKFNSEIEADILEFLQI